MKFKYNKKNIGFLKGRDFLKLLDFTPEEIGGLIDLAAELKDKKKNKIINENSVCEFNDLIEMEEK